MAEPTSVESKTVCCTCGISARAFPEIFFVETTVGAICADCITEHALALRDHNTLKLK